MSWLPRLHLKTKLIASIVITTVFAVIASSATLVYYDRAQEVKNVSEDMKILAGIVANRSTAALIFSDVIQAEANLKALGENPNVLMACIYDSGQQVFAIHHFPHLDKKLCPESPK